MRLRAARQCGRNPYQDFKIIIDPHIQRVAGSPNQTGLQNCHLLFPIKMLYFTRQLVEALQDQERKTTQSLVETHQESWRGGIPPLSRKPLLCLISF